MLDAGLNQTLVSTGEYDNVMVTRRSAGTEVQSSVSREQASIVESQPEVMIDADGVPMVSKEVVVLIALPKRGSGAPANVVIRGVAAQGQKLRPQVKLVEGRNFRPGSTEIIVGRSIAERFAGAELGRSLHFAQRDWTIVGLFDANKSGFDSEIWGDGDQLLQSFRRISYSSVVLRLADSARFADLRARIEADPRLTVEAKREQVFYAEQSQLLSGFINYLGVTLSIIFSIGAMIGAMITMYAAVATRTREIGALRALGFRKRSILGAFMLEALALAGVGWVIGLGLASFMQAIEISTLNWTSFSELAFSFVLTPRIVLLSLLFALIMGLVGGFLPALRAARMKIVDALRAA